MSRAPRRSVAPCCEALEPREVPAFLAPIVSTGTLDALGDFNNDGRIDLALSSRDRASVSVLRNDGIW